MKPWLYVGAKVVCVDDSPIIRGIHPKLSKDAVYTVAAIGTQPNGVEIALGEMPRTGGRCRDEYGDDRFYYNVIRFRPVSTIDTTHTVNEMRSLMLDATVRGRVRV